MGFNPLHTFSARSRTGRAVLAVLTIVVMIMFVLSSGAVGSGLDFLDQLGSLFGSSKGKGEVVAVAFGDKIHTSELSQIQQQRQVANQFLRMAVHEAYMNWTRSLADDAKANRL